MPLGVAAYNCILLDRPYLWYSLLILGARIAGIRKSFQTKGLVCTRSVCWVRISFTTCFRSVLCTYYALLANNSAKDIKVKEQTVVRLKPVGNDEILKGFLELRLVGVINHHHLKSLLLQNLGDGLHVSLHPRQAGPAARVVAHPDNESVALLVEPNGFTSLVLNGDDLNAPGGGKGRRRKNKDGNQESW